MYTEIINTPRGSERHVKGRFAVAFSVIFIAIAFVSFVVTVWLSICSNGSAFSLLSGLVLCFVAGILFWRFCPNIIANEIKSGIIILIGSLIILVTSGLVWPAIGFAIIEKPNENIIIAKDSFSFQMPLTKINYWSGFVPVVHFDLQLEDAKLIQLRVSVLLKKDIDLAQVSKILKRFTTREQWNEAVEATIEKMAMVYLEKHIVLTTDFPVEIQFHPTIEHKNEIKQFGYRFDGLITIQQAEHR